MIAIDDGRVSGLERFRSRDIGRDHEIFNDAVGIKPFAYGDFRDLTLFVQDNAAFGQFELQRIAFFARRGEQFPCTPKVGEVVRRVARIDGSLRILIGDIVMNTHNGSGETLCFHLSALIDVNMAHHRRAIFVFS